MSWFIPMTKANRAWSGRSPGGRLHPGPGVWVFQPADTLPPQAAHLTKTCLVVSGALRAAGSWRAFKFEAEQFIQVLVVMTGEWGASGHEGPEGSPGFRVSQFGKGRDSGLAEKAP